MMRPLPLSLSPFLSQTLNSVLDADPVRSLAPISSRFLLSQSLVQDCGSVSLISRFEFGDVYRFPLDRVLGTDPDRFREHPHSRVPSGKRRLRLWNWSLSNVIKLNRDCQSNLWWRLQNLGH
ncbi:hypothetical protein BT93_J2022 [Corymbia citriodora subsp. variegata]|nr:hypothetical protein BT93_J2022 [Corymbia citriodora subsp. variegata]KAF8011608.1 hypothetical protein BT93_J2022 [Corymbia citriodora subsp. variegata]